MSAMIREAMNSGIFPTMEIMEWVQQKYGVVLNKKTVEQAKFIYRKKIKERSIDTAHVATDVATLRLLVARYGLTEVQRLLVAVA